MSGRLRTGSATTRRRLLTTFASATATTALNTLAAPAFSRSAQRPMITHGVQSGDVSADSGMVWARTDRPARMQIEIATSDSFNDIHYASFVDALPETDFTAKALIEDLPAGQDVFYRLRAQDLSSPNSIGKPMVGRFRTAPYDRRSVSFVWSGDTAGQGWGIDTSRGGMRTYATMLRSRPDFFVHCGDSIYADCAIPVQQKLPNGETWRNIVTEEKSKVAATLAEYRGNYNTTCSTQTCGPSMPKSRFSPNGTTTRSWRIGRRAKHLNAAAMQQKAHCCSPRVGAAHSMSTCRCDTFPPSRAVSTGRFHMARCSSCFFSICAVIAARTTRARRVTTIRTAIFSARRRSCGSSVSSSVLRQPGK